ncbi:MAG: cytochrome c3 family protein [bacterium]
MRKTTIRSRGHVLELWLTLSLAFSLWFSPGASARSRSPHTYSSQVTGVSCRKCHERKPKSTSTEEEVKAALKSQYTRSCRECHRNQIPQSCELSSSKGISAILLNQISPFPLPLFQGQISCLSCHRIHLPSRQADHPFILHKAYDALVKASERINPHQSGLFCFLCHDREPRKGSKELHLKFQGDTVALCKSCHNNQRAKADNHPVRITPSKNGRVHIPEGFPLSQGKVTCITCHKLPCQGKQENPFFLRGGPYQRRIDTCLVCHVKAQFMKINPHDQLTDEGDIREDRCLFCHEINKENATGLAFKFKTSLKFYCLGCHPIDIKTHPFGAHHTGRQLHSVWGHLKPSERLKLAQYEKFKMFPLTLSGKIMCTTCHNPHDIRKGPKLRIGDVNKSCQQCHYKKYGPILKEEEYHADQWLPQKSHGQTPAAQGTPDEEDLTPPQEDTIPFGYRASLNFYCIGCHANKETNHPYGIMHTGKFVEHFWQSRSKSKEENADFGGFSDAQIFPLTLSGQIGCFTCHDPHNGAKGPKLRVESKEQLCTLCHPDRSKIIEPYLRSNPREQGEGQKE